MNGFSPFKCIIFIMRDSRSQHNTVDKDYILLGYDAVLTDNVTTVFKELATHIITEVEEECSSFFSFDEVLYIEFGMCSIHSCLFPTDT